MKQAVILAAGEGQRLRPFTVNRPKVMLFIAGKPILQYVIEALAQKGVRDISLVVGYHKEQVLDYFGSGESFGVDLTYVNQDRQLGTAHALVQAKEAIKDDFLVLPGDNLIAADTIDRFTGVEPEAVLVKKVDNPMRYGVVTVQRGTVKEIQEKPEEAASHLVSTGIYAFSRAIFDFVEPQLDLPDVVNRMLSQGHKIKALETDGVWLDAVYPWDVLNLNAAVLQQVQAKSGGTIEAGVSLKGQVSIGKGTVIRSNSYIAGPAVIGEGCEIGPSVCIFPATSIGNNVVMAPFTEVKNSVIGNDVNIGSGSIIHDSVIDNSCSIGGQFAACSGQEEVTIDKEHHLVSFGAMLGEGCTLGNSVVAQPGVIVGNYSQIRSLKLISGRLPDRSLVV
ncbi:MAG: bifunctional sugar-1-phosphate nucleotidylyltransferase/acetyltransferase [Chloroflexota bacterium]|nr:NTP transferase domain-containing protein [Chloroflexota bacterium]